VEHTLIDTGITYEYRHKNGEVHSARDIQEAMGRCAVLGDMEQSEAEIMLSLYAIGSKKIAETAFDDEGEPLLQLEELQNGILEDDHPGVKSNSIQQNHDNHAEQTQETDRDQKTGLQGNNIENSYTPQIFASKEFAASGRDISDVNDTPGGINVDNKPLPASVELKSIDRTFTARPWEIKNTEHKPNIADKVNIVQYESKESPPPVAKVELTDNLALNEFVAPVKTGVINLTPIEKIIDKSIDKSFDITVLRLEVDNEENNVGLNNAHSVQILQTEAEEVPSRAYDLENQQIEVNQDSTINNLEEFGELVLPDLGWRAPYNGLPQDEKESAVVNVLNEQSALTLDVSLSTEDVFDFSEYSEGNPETVIDHKGTAEEIEQHLILIADKIEAASAETSEEAHIILDDITEMIANTHNSIEAESAGESGNSEAMNIEDKVKEKFIQLFGTLGIDHTPELAESLAKLTLSTNRIELGSILNVGQLEDTSVDDRGTHEIIRKLLATGNNFKKLGIYTYQIGKLALRLYSVRGIITYA
jgi:hypothetical protein